MKTKHYLAIAAILFIFIYSCRKDFSNHDSIPITYPSVTSFNIKQAKSYMDSVTNSSSSTIKLQSFGAVQTGTKGYLYWKKAHQLVLQQFNVVEVPIAIERQKISLYNFAYDQVSIAPDKSVAIASFSRAIIYQD